MGENQSLYFLFCVHLVNGKSLEIKISLLVISNKKWIYFFFWVSSKFLISFNYNMKVVLPLPIFLADVNLLRLADLLALIFICIYPNPQLILAIFF